MGRRVAAREGWADLVNGVESILKKEVSELMCVLLWYGSS